MAEGTAKVAPMVISQGTPAPAPMPGVKAKAVLVVEDEEGVRTLAVQLLEEQGYTVLEAANGAEALQVLSRQGAAVSLMLTDMAAKR